MALTPFAVLIYSTPLYYQTAPLSAAPQDSPQQLAPTGNPSVMSIYPPDTSQLFSHGLVLLEWSFYISAIYCPHQLAGKLPAFDVSPPKKKKGFIVRF